jgi:hypothetical protein
MALSNTEAKSPMQWLMGWWLFMGEWGGVIRCSPPNVKISQGLARHFEGRQTIPSIKEFTCHRLRKLTPRL